MRLLKLLAVSALICFVMSCEKKDEMANKTTDATITGFETDFCNCCWGWVIEVGSHTIKADTVPGLSIMESVIFPFDVRITTGNKILDCSELSKPDYYEILECTLLE